jgi:hypothetical protein
MYYYILDKGNKRVFEFLEGADEGNKELFIAMEIKLYDVFPYEEAGYSDPFSFMDDYEVIKFFRPAIIEVKDNV